MDKVDVFTDGGSRGNPGPSASAYLIFKNDEMIASGTKFLGISTNNRAEYIAVGLALRALMDEVKNINADEVIFHIDSQLVVKQLSGDYKIKDPTLRKLATKIKMLENRIRTKIKYVFVYREKNKEADRLVNKELDKNLQNDPNGANAHASDAIKTN